MTFNNINKLEKHLASFFIAYVIFFSFFHRYFWNILDIPSTQHAFDVVGIVLPSVVIFVTLAIKKKDSFYLTLSDCFFLFFILWLILSSFNVFNISVFNTAYAFKGGSRWILLFICYYCLKQVFSSYKNSLDHIIRWLIPIFGLVVIASYLIGNCNTLLKVFDPLVKEEYDIIIKSARSFLGLKNSIASFLLLTIVVLVTTTRPKGSLLILNQFYYVIAFLFLLFLQSRNVFFSLAVFSGLYLLINSKAYEVKSIQRDIFYKLVPILILLVLLFINIDPNQYFSSLLKNTMHSRFVLWKQSLKLFVQSPVFGIGNFQWQILNVYDSKLTHPHNDHVRVILELGAVGFVLYNAIFIVQYLKALRLSPIRRNTILTLLIAILCFHTLGFFDCSTHRLSHCILFMVILARTEVELFEDNLLFFFESKIQAFKTVYKSCVMLLMIGVLAYPIVIYKNVIHVEKLKESLTNNDTSAIEKAVNKIDFNLYPDYYMKPMYHKIGDYFMQNNDEDMAVIYYEKSLRYYPNSDMTVILLSKIYKRNGAEMDKLENNMRYKMIKKLHKQKDGKATKVEK